MNTERVVTIDGLSGSGKSSLGKALAIKLGVPLFRSGLIYRSVGVWGKRLNINFGNSKQFIHQLQSEGVELSIDSNQEVVCKIGGVELDELFLPHSSEAASMVSQNPDLRDYLLGPQRELLILAKKHSNNHLVDLVAEGRDMGSVVYPDAIKKFYLQVSVSERLNRRSQQFELDQESLKKELLERDERDCSRSVAPAVRPKGSVLIKNEFGEFDKVLDKMYQLVISS